MVKRQEALSESDLWYIDADKRGHGFYRRTGKRMMDVALAVFMIAVLVLPLIIVAGLLLLTQGRPLIYSGKRMKAPGQPFFQYKFRTMVRVDEDGGATGAHKNWRITRLGGVLRRTRLDELPQLFNILMGDMSFVGPRPPLPEYVERFPSLYAAILTTPPGVTGLATLIYHRHEDRIMANCKTAEETDRAYYARCLPTKLRIELVYRRTASPVLDLWIMWKTVLAVIPGLDRPRKKRSRDVSRRSLESAPSK
ncbi:sugar transferase [Paracoccus aerodenitrificans]|uniref:sugar transferase n=1 Tax=Paracoccus aerodenitrificans TaxID=3017781 RepID=UPI0022F00FDC|nr:sugar transferase [Paracoccus aerodenitrificans]WBU64235.1 sugar transferase [Paracoccus aerodenitrificans]